MNIFGFAGVPVNPKDMQNAVPQYSFEDLRPYVRSPEGEIKYNLGLQQYKMVPDAPLDERFADFKVRLAAAIARRRA